MPQRGGEKAGTSGDRDRIQIRRDVLVGELRRLQAFRRRDDVLPSCCTQTALPNFSEHTIVMYLSDGPTRRCCVSRRRVNGKSSQPESHSESLLIPVAAV